MRLPDGRPRRQRQFTAKFELGGDLGATRLTLNGDATGDPEHLGAAVVRVDRPA